MSLLQNQDYVIHRIRTRYLNSVRDGVGERLITFSSNVLNIPGYKNAGWPNAADIRRTYSPPIPAGTSTDYFAGLPKSAAFDRSSNYDEDGEDDTKTPGQTDLSHSPVADLFAKDDQDRPANLMPNHDDDSSDLSDESDLEEDMGRAVQQIKFSKMPIRQRAGSSPTMSSNPKLMITSPGKMSKTRLRSGSHDMIEYEKSKEFNSAGNELRLLSHRIDEDTEAFKEIAHKLRASPATSFRDPQEADFDSEDDSDDDGSTLSSDFTETADSNPGILSSSSPIKPLFANNPKETSSLDPLPPPRPISQMFPVSTLTQLIKANAEEILHPLDVYTHFSGKGDIKSVAPGTAVSRRGAGPQGSADAPLRLKIYRPTSDQPSKPWELIIKRFVIVEGLKQETSVADAVGFALYRYREEGLNPPLTEEQYNINRWTFRIVEEDGEPDFDFPALDRTRAISAYSLDELALVEATQAQFEEYDKKFPVKNLVKEKASEPQQTSVVVVTASPKVTPARPADSPAPAAHSSARTGISKTLKIFISTPEVFDQSVTVRVTSDTYIAEVLDLICKKKHLDRSRHILKIHGVATIVPLDRTVESLQGHGELELVIRKFTDAIGDRPGSPSTTNNPNTPLTIGMTKAPARNKSMLSQSVAAADMLLGAGYQKFTVWRKMPMSFISRHERVLAIDGEYIHIMPSDSNKTLFESPKTTSIHISALIGCKQSKKAPNNFKLIIMKSREWKRYVFEASSPAQAAEIVIALKKQMTDYKIDQEI